MYTMDRPGPDICMYVCVGTVSRPHGPTNPLVVALRISAAPTRLRARPGPPGGTRWRTRVQMDASSRWTPWAQARPGRMTVGYLAPSFGAALAAKKGAARSGR